jgi:hypothetical protein
MGMDQTVRFPRQAIPPWPDVSAMLTQRGFPVEMRMIDGELAFPDETPAETWRELRIGTPQGMVTLRRQADAITFVTWGNADQALQQAWNALVWAFAHVGEGVVQAATGPVDAAQYHGLADLPAPLR